MNVPTIKSSALMSGLENPWDMAFLSDGTMFSRRSKGLSVRTRDGSVNALYGMKDSKGYGNSGSTFCSGHRNVGCSCRYRFCKNRAIYAYSTSTKYHGSGCKTNFEKCDGNIVMRFNVSKDLKSVSNRTDIVKDIQYKPFESNQPFGGPGA